MGKPKGINQVSIHLKLDKELLEPLQKYCKDLNENRNKSINKMVRYMLMKYKIQSEKKTEGRR